MKPIMKVVRVRRPTPDRNSTAAARSGANAHNNQVTRLGWVVPRKVSRTYTAEPQAPMAAPRYTKWTLITG